MALFQRLKTPFVESEAEPMLGAPTGPRSAGDFLRQRREELGIDLPQCARALNIKAAFLAALEDGRPDRLPGAAYAIGFVRAYGDYLGLDSVALLRRFKSESGALDARPDLTFPMPLGERSLPGGGMLLVALILAICGYGTWYYLGTAQRDRPQRIGEVPLALLAPKPKPVAPAAVSPPTAPAATTAGTPTPALAPAPPQTAAAAAPAAAAPPAPSSAPTPPADVKTAAPPAAAPVAPPVAATPARVPAANPPAPPPAAPAVTTASAAAATPPAAADPANGHSYGAAAGPVRIVIRATADSWIQVSDADQDTLFTRTLRPGESYRVPDRPGLLLRTGNAGGLDIEVDGRPAPSLGKSGMVRRDVALEPQSLETGASAAHD